MLKPRKQRKRIPITLKGGLLKALKGKVLRFDDLYYGPSDSTVSAYFVLNSRDYFGPKSDLSIEGADKFVAFERLIKHLEDKNVLIYAPFECSTWVVAGDKAAMRKALKRPRGIGQSRLKREDKNHCLCTEEELTHFRAEMDGLDAFYRDVPESDNPYPVASIKHHGWQEGWHEGNKNEQNVKGAST